MGLVYKCILPTLGRMWARLPQMERMQVAISPKYRGYLVQYNIRWWTSTNIPCRQRAYKQAQNPSIRTFAQIWDTYSVHYISCHPMCSRTCQAGSWPRILESLTCSFGRGGLGETYVGTCIRCPCCGSNKLAGWSCRDNLALEPWSSQAPSVYKMTWH